MELLHRRCCGLDVHKETVVACLRLVSDGKVTTEVHSRPRSRYRREFVAWPEQVSFFLEPG